MRFFKFKERPKDHKLWYYQGFAGVRGYHVCTVCHHKNPTGECGGKEEGRRYLKAEQDWWRDWQSHMENLDLPPFNF